MRNPVIELTVNNHPGVMTHITSLFSRRAFNLEGILCGALGDGTESRMFLMVHEDRRLEQCLKELERLHDVKEVKLRTDIAPRLFDPEQVLRG